MNLELIGFVLSSIGKIMIAYTAVKVHYRFWKEHKIDEDVFREMKKEQKIGIIGVGFLIIGFILELPFKL